MSQRNNILEKIFLHTYFIWGFILQYVYTVNIIFPFRQQILAVTNGLAIVIFLMYIIGYFAENLSHIYLIGFVGIIIFLILGVVYSKNQIGIAYIATFLLIVGAGTINFKKILKIFVDFSTITLISTILLNLLKIIPSVVLFSNGRLRNSLGFYYVSFASAIMFYYICAYLVYRGKDISYWELGILLIGDVFIFSYTRTNNPFLLSTIFIIYVFIYKILNMRVWTRIKLFKFLAIFIFPFSFLFLIWLLRAAPVSIFDQINKLVSYRLSFSLSALNNYGIKPIGRKIVMITTDALGGFGGANYNYIDSFYIQNLIINGYIFILFVLIGYTMIMFKAVKEKREILVMALVIIALHAIFDPQLFWAWYSPFSLILGQLFFKNQNSRLLI